MALFHLNVTQIKRSKGQSAIAAAAYRAGEKLYSEYYGETSDYTIKIDMLEEEIQNQEDQADNVDKFIRQAKKYLHLEKLTPTILNDMVNAVYVHSPDKSSGHRVQDVEISYNYIGILPATLLYDLQNEKTA